MQGETGVAAFPEALWSETATNPRSDNPNFLARSGREERVSELPGGRASLALWRPDPVVL